MLAKRIVPCLDVRDGVVVKGVQFKNHVVLGGIVELARRYRDQGADELVFYDIMASVENRSVDPKWVEDVAHEIDIPFCVAGGIKSVESARALLHSGADKVSINSPAHERPGLISELAETFGSQCVVLGVDSKRHSDGRLVCWKNTGSETSAEATEKLTLEWVKQGQALGAGEIVLNAMDADGTRDGYALEQLRQVKDLVSIPVVASGGAGTIEHFIEAAEAGADAMLAAGIFHRGELSVRDVKDGLRIAGVPVRPDDRKNT